MESFSGEMNILTITTENINQDDKYLHDSTTKFSSKSSEQE